LFKGEYDRAIADYDKAILLDPKPAWVYSFRGAAYLQKGNYALADYDQSPKLDPNFARTREGRERGISSSWWGSDRAGRCRIEADRSIFRQDWASNRNPERV
jgi:tetratricopeptide (TPR) repeat protein